MSILVGVSLKLYFGYAETLDWCRRVASAAAAHGGVRDGAVGLFILPSFPVLPAAVEIFAGTPVAVGAQNLWSTDRGAFTGEVGGSMLAELGVRYVEVGHAERRTLLGENETMVAAKTAAALRNRLVPVLCLGESDRGPADEAAAECVRQLDSALAESRRLGLTGAVVVAYEPHWAIGAAEPAAEQHIGGVCAALRARLAGLTRHPGSQVIYGGSAGPGLLTRIGGSVDGVFLGRSAHDPTALVAVLDEASALAAERSRS